MDEESIDIINSRIWLGIDQCIITCHGDAKSRGWWTDISSGRPIDRHVPEMLCLIHSEISEALEGYRKSTKDENCPEFTSLEIELADALIRIFDLAGGIHLKLGDAITAKLTYNRTRYDHSVEARLAENGKKF